MDIETIDGDNLEQALGLCYKYLKEKYEKEVLNLNDRNICKSKYRGASKEWIQPNGSDKTMQKTI